MSFRQAHQTSSSDSDPRTTMDQRKRKRMESNRESARRSRMRKQQHLDDLINMSARLKNENNQIAMQISHVTRQYAELESGNMVLRTQLMELAEQLKSVSSVLRFVEEFSGMAMDIPEMPGTFLKPWRMPCPSQAILASPSMNIQY